MTSLIRYALLLSSLPCLLLGTAGVRAQTPTISPSIMDMATSTQILTATQLVSQNHFNGTWSTSFGELRLHQTDNMVMGDYGGVGVILAEVMTPDCIAGVFTNGNRFGQFSFRISAENTFAGVYRWGDSGSGASWSGTRTDSATPSHFYNFTASGEAKPHIANDNKTLNGTWQSGYGALRLRQSNLFLYGDYADRGVIIARWNGLQFEGAFTNREMANQPAGSVTFGADILAGNITGGTWQFEGGSGGNWTVNGSDRQSPAFTNVAVEGACQPLWPF